MFQRQLPTFNLNVNGVEEFIDPNEDLAIYDGDLNTEFAEQPRKYAFYGGLYVDAAVTLEDLKIKIDQYKASIVSNVRERLTAKYGDGERYRFSEDKMKAEYALDETLQALQEMYMEQERKVNRLEIIKKAFEQRSQMLWNIGATRRQEMVRMVPSNEEE